MASVLRYDLNKSDMSLVKHSDLSFTKEIYISDFAKQYTSIQIAHKYWVMKRSKETFHN